MTAISQAESIQVGLAIRIEVKESPAEPIGGDSLYFELEHELSKRQAHRELQQQAEHQNAVVFDGHDERRYMMRLRLGCTATLTYTEKALIRKLRSS